jgi:hypothetical protein
MTTVRAARAFIGRRRRRSWLDWYFIGFVAVVAALYLADILTGPLSRLSAAAGHPDTGQAAAQAISGAGLVLGVGIGLLLLAQALGPLALSPADTSWLLPSPLARRPLLRRSAGSVAAAAVLAGALLGVLTLAMAGPYLRPGASTLPASWLVLSAIAGAALCLAAVAAQALAQPRERAGSVVRTIGAVVGFVAMLGALIAERSGGIANAITTGFGGLSVIALQIVTVVMLILAASATALAWRLLPSFPASVLRSDSARTGRALTAAAFLNLQLLTWIAEDNHWRDRILRSRRWPRLRPAMVLAWADWRRLSRRPGLLVVTASAALIPALVGAAITGHYRGYVVAVALLLGGIAAGAQGTVGAKRDLNDPTLRRMLAVDPAQALAARAVLPALLSAAWLALACGVLVAVGVLHGGLWIAVGLAAGPGAAAAALRMARTAPINPTEPGIDLPMGSTPPGMISRLLSLIVGAIATYPMLGAIAKDHLHPSTPISQLIVSAIVGGIYLMVAGRLV